jgi:hypothetical protein
MTHPFDPRLVPFLGASTRARAAVFSELAPSPPNGPSDNDAKRVAAAERRVATARAELAAAERDLAGLRGDGVPSDGAPPADPPLARAMTAIDRAMGLDPPAADPVTIGPGGQLRISHLDPITRGPR